MGSAVLNRPVEYGPWVLVYKVDAAMRTIKNGGIVRATNFKHWLQEDSKDIGGFISEAITSESEIRRWLDKGHALAVAYPH